MPLGPGGPDRTRRERACVDAQGFVVAVDPGSRMVLRPIRDRNRSSDRTPCSCVQRSRRGPETAKATGLATPHNRWLSESAPGGGGPFFGRFAPGARSSAPHSLGLRGRLCHVTKVRHTRSQTDWPCRAHPSNASRYLPTPPPVQANACTTHPGSVGRRGVSPVKARPVDGELPLGRTLSPGPVTGSAGHLANKHHGKSRSTGAYWLRRILTQSGATRRRSRRLLLTARGVVGNRVPGPFQHRFSTASAGGATV